MRAAAVRRGSDERNASPKLGASAQTSFRQCWRRTGRMLLFVAPPLVAGLSHPCVESDLRSRSNEPAGTHYLRGPTATYATADVRVLSLASTAFMCPPPAHAEACLFSPRRREWWCTVSSATAPPRVTFPCAALHRRRRRHCRRRRRRQGCTCSRSHCHTGCPRCGRRSAAHRSALEVGSGKTARTVLQRSTCCVGCIPAAPSAEAGNPCGWCR